MLHTHTLRKLSEVLNKELKIGLDVMGLSFLKDFYFEARYPGDNFSSVTQEQHDKCKEIMEETLKRLQPFISDYDFVNGPLQDMNSF